MLRKMLILSAFLLISSGLMYAQDYSYDTNLYDSYEDYKRTLKTVVDDAGPECKDQIPQVSSKELKETNTIGVQQIETKPNHPRQSMKNMTKSERLTYVKKRYEDGIIDLQNYEIIKARIEAQPQD